MGEAIPCGRAPRRDLMDLCRSKPDTPTVISPLQTASVCLISMKPVKILRGTSYAPKPQSPAVLVSWSHGDEVQPTGHWFK